jgi:hypothetical protein
MPPNQLRLFPPSRLQEERIGLTVPGWSEGLAFRATIATIERLLEARGVLRERLVNAPNETRRAAAENEIAQITHRIHDGISALARSRAVGYQVRIDNPQINAAVDLVVARIRQRPPPPPEPTPEQRLAAWKSLDDRTAPEDPAACAEDEDEPDC